MEAASRGGHEPVAALVDVIGVPAEEAGVEEDLAADLDERRPALVEVELPVQRHREAETCVVVPVGPVATPAHPVEVRAEVQVHGVVDRGDEPVLEDREPEAHAGGRAPPPPREAPVEIELHRAAPGVGASDVHRALSVRGGGHTEQGAEGESGGETGESGHRASVFGDQAAYANSFIQCASPMVASSRPFTHRVPVLAALSDRASAVLPHSSPGTNLGSARSPPEVPSWPLLFRPQQSTAPSTTAHAC